MPPRNPGTGCPRVLAIALTTICLLTGPSLSAQPATDEPSESQLLSDMLVRYALWTLSTAPMDERAEAHQHVAATLLDQAIELQPQDSELWWLRGTLAGQSGEDLKQIEALQRYVNLEPDDDAVLLELLRLRIAESRTIDGRLTKLENVLARGNTGSMTDAVRSRLASDAAILADQLGDNGKFVRYLKTAVNADRSNHEAARLLYRLAEDRNASSLQKGIAAIGLVRSAPLDGESRLRLAEALADLGVFGSAAEQYATAAKVLGIEGLPPESLRAWSRSLIASGRVDQAQRLLDQLRAMTNPSAEDSNDRVSDSQAATNPSAATLPMMFELHQRVLSGDNEQGRAALDRAIAQLEKAIEAGEPGSELELAWVLSVFTDQTERVASLLKGQPQDDPRYHRAAGFAHVNDGATRWARASFEQVAEQDAVAAFGLAKLRGLDKAGQSRFLAEVVRNDPDSFGGLLAANELNRNNRSVPASREGRVLIDAMEREPIGLWRLDVEQNAWTSLRASFPSVRAEFLEPIRVDLNVHNASGIPLAIGSSGTLGSTLLTSVSPFVAGRPMNIAMPPIVNDFSRKLSLPTGQSLSQQIRLDRSVFGLFLATQTPTTVNYNASFILDPRFLPNGAAVSAPLGAFDSVRSLQAFVPGVNKEMVDVWVNDLNHEKDRVRFTAIAQLGRLEQARERANLDSRTVRQGQQALTNKYENADDRVQAWTLLTLNIPESSATGLQPILDEAIRSENRLVQMAYLVGVIDDPNDRALATVIRESDGKGRRFAEAWQTVLEANAAAEASMIPEPQPGPR